MKGSPLRTRLCWAFVAATLGILFTCAAYFPGYMSSDSLEQLTAARTHVIQDWHPPLMTVLWGFFDRIVPGPAGMLVFHNVLFWSGAAIVAALAFESVFPTVATVLALGFCPAVFALLGTIWKDVGMGCALFLAVALLLLSVRLKSRAAFALVWPPLFYALSVRHDSILAIGPVCVWAAVQYRATFNARGQFLAWMAAGSVVAVLLSVANGRMNRALVGANRTYPDQIVMLYDLAQLSVAENAWLMPDYLAAPAQRAARFAELKELFRREDCPTRYCFGLLDVFPLDQSLEHLAALRKTWVDTVPHHWRAFLEMKVRIARYDYSFGTSGVLYPFHTGIDPNNLGVKLKPSRLNQHVMRVLYSLDSGAWFRAWVWLVVLVAMMFAAAVTGFRANLGVLLLGCGALLKDLLYLTWWPGYDFRYHWWTVLAVLLMPLAWRILRGARPSEVAT